MEAWPRGCSRRCLCALARVWATKNFGIDQAGSDWILVVDADERVTDGLRQEIQALLAVGPPADIGGYEIPRRNYFYGKWIQGGGLYPDYQLRLFRKTAGRYDDVRLHENFVLQGRRERCGALHPLQHADREPPHPQDDAVYHAGSG